MRHASLCTQAVAVVVSLSILLYPALPAVAQAQEAGKVTAQIPRAQIDRVAGPLPAEVNTQVLWDDLVTTQPRGRVRITLDDSSILNVGSDSSLRVVRHNATTSETDLVLTYGKMRVRTQKVGAGGHFEVRTNTAVLGVIGSYWYVGATATRTHVIVYEGVLSIRNINPAIMGTQQVFAGQQAFINAGQPPSAPSSVKGNDWQDSVDDTEVGENLPPPPPPQGPPPPGGGIPTWVWIAAVAGFTAVMVTVPLATDNGSGPQTRPKPPRVRQRCVEC